MAAQEAERSDFARRPAPPPRPRRDRWLTVAPEPVRETSSGRRGSKFGRAFRIAAAWTAVGPPS
jgi:hypothetical protein